MSNQNSDNNKRIAKNTLMLYFRMLIMMGVNLYTSRVALDVLGASDFGLYNVVGGFVTMFTLISGAMTTASQRFLSFEIGKGNRGDVQSLFSTAVLIHVYLALIIFVVGESFGVWFVNTQMNFQEGRYIAANWVFQFSLITLIVNVLSVPYNAALVAYERMSAFAYISILEALLKLAIIFLLVVSPFDKLILYAALLALIAITIRIIYSVYCHRNFKDCSCNWKCDKEQRAKILSFVSWNLIGSFAVVMKEQGINILLNIFFGTTVNAAKGIVSQVNTAMHGFVSNFQLAMNPQIVKSYASQDFENMYKIVFRGSKFSFFLIYALSLPVILEAPYILSIWLKIVPEHTVTFLRIILMTAMITSLSGTLITSMHASGKVRDYQITVGGLSLLALPISYLLLKLGFPAKFALIVIFMVEATCHFVRLYMLKKSICFPMIKFVRMVTLRCLFVVAVSIILPVFVCSKLDFNFISFLIASTVSLLSVLTCEYFIGLDKNEKNIVKNKIIKRFK